LTFAFVFPPPQFAFRIPQFFAPHGSPITNHRSPSPHYSFLLNFPSVFGARLASISDLKFEAIQTKRATWVSPGLRGKIMKLSIETKVAIAVATGFAVLIVGAMAQG
jgi:hypothetical protein